MGKRAMGGFLLVAAASALVAAGCGDHDETTTTSAGTSGATGAAGSVSADEWASQADAICKQGDKGLTAAGREFFEDQGLSGNEEPTPDQLEQYTRETVVPNIQEQIYDVVALPQPEGEEGQIQDFLDQAQSDLHYVQDHPGVLADESNDPFAETSKLAKDLGLTECAS
jgi:hypothetical protein